MKQKKIVPAVMTLGFGLAMLAGCHSTEPVATATPEPEETVAPVVDSAAPAGEWETARVAMLKGPTGLGAAYLMENVPAGYGENGDQEKYTFSVLADPTEAVAGLTKGELDIAALPTNLASTLYHKTEGGIQLLALNTYGTLYVLENGETVETLADLEGKTVHAYGQGANPEFVLNYLLEKNGVDGESVDVQWHASTDEVAALMVSGEGEVCMLPVPAATTVLMQNQEVRQALDLTEEWENAGGEGVLTMGCVVARTEFVAQHPEEVAEFLKDYEESIAYMTEESHLEEGAALAEKWGIVPKAAVAQKAIPAANLCFVTGDDMMDGIQGYYQVLYQANPASIGGSIPDGAFYYRDK